jgi:hypothetical protein
MRNLLLPGMGAAPQKCQRGTPKSTALGKNWANGLPMEKLGLHPIAEMEELLYA